MISFILQIRSKEKNIYYEIEQKDDNSLWIGDGTGEGGEFDSEKFFEVIDKFYQKNF